MNIVIFGLTISSAWGNGHATLWRALCRALARRGHHVTFFEQDLPYYAQHRDLSQPAGYSLILYDCWKNVRGDAVQALKNADSWAYFAGDLVGAVPKSTVRDVLV